MPMTTGPASLPLGHAGFFIILKCSQIIFKGTSTSVTPPDYTCTPGQIHILCQCCFQPMPNSWPDRLTATIPAQKCKCSFTLLRLQNLIKPAMETKRLITIFISSSTLGTLDLEGGRLLIFIIFGK